MIGEYIRSDDLLEDVAYARPSEGMAIERRPSWISTRLSSLLQKGWEPRVFGPDYAEAERDMNYSLAIPVGALVLYSPRERLHFGVAIEPFPFTHVEIVPVQLEFAFYGTGPSSDRLTLAQDMERYRVSLHPVTLYSCRTYFSERVFEQRIPPKNDISVGEKVRWKPNSCADATWLQIGLLREHQIVQFKWGNWIKLRGIGDLLWSGYLERTNQ